MRAFLLALLLVLGCATPGPSTFVTLYVEGKSATFSPATLQGEEVTAPGFTPTAVTLEGQSVPVKRSKVTVQNRSGGVAQGNVELVVERGGQEVELRGSFKASAP